MRQIPGEIGQISIDYTLLVGYTYSTFHFHPSRSSFFVEWANGSMGR
jgi:hypothetical protein